MHQKHGREGKGANTALICEDLGDWSDRRYCRCSTVPSSEFSNVGLEERSLSLYNSLYLLLLTNKLTMSLNAMRLLCSYVSQLQAFLLHCAPLSDLVTFSFRCVMMLYFGPKLFSFGLRSPLVSALLESLGRFFLLFSSLQIQGFFFPSVFILESVHLQLKFPSWKNVFHLQLTQL